MKGIARDAKDFLPITIQNTGKYGELRDARGTDAPSIVGLLARE